MKKLIARVQEAVTEDLEEEENNAPVSTTDRHVQLVKKSLQELGRIAPARMDKLMVDLLIELKDLEKAVTH